MIAIDQFTAGRLAFLGSTKRPRLLECFTHGRWSSDLHVCWRNVSEFSIVCQQVPVYIWYYCLPTDTSLYFVLLFATGTNFHFVVLFADRYQFTFCIIFLERIAGPVQAWYIINRFKPLVVITFVRLLEHIL